MAVTIASTDQLTSDITTGVSTFSVTRASGEGLLIGFAWKVEWEAQPTINSVVWDQAGDNQNLTLIDNVQFNDDTRRIAVYYLANPTTAKSSNIKVNWSKSCGSSGVGAIVRHITGHDTSSMVRGYLTTIPGAFDSSNPISNTISSSSTDVVIDFFGVRDTAANISPLSGQTSAYEADFYSGSQSISSSQKAGGTTVTTGFQTVNSYSYGAALIQVSVKESTGGGGATATVTGTTALPAFSGSAQVSPEASITVTTALPAFSGGASTGAASSTVTATTSLPSFSGSATGDTSSGTLTLPVLKNNTGTVLANETGATVHVYAVSTGNKVVTKTGQTTNASGVMTVTDALIVGGTQYRVVVVLGSGAEGLDKVTAS